MSTALEFEALMSAAASRLSAELPPAPASFNATSTSSANTNSTALLTQSSGPPSNIIERSAIWLARREEKVLEMRRQVEAVQREDERGLTFSPKINRVRCLSLSIVLCVV